MGNANIFYLETFPGTNVLGLEGTWAALLPLLWLITLLSFLLCTHSPIETPQKSFLVQDFTVSSFINVFINSMNIFERSMLRALFCSRYTEQKTGTESVSGSFQSRLDAENNDDICGVKCCVGENRGGD